MLLRLSRWLATKNTSWLTFLALMIFLLFMVFVLPSQVASTTKLPENIASPDTSFFYSADSIYQMASNYGVEGRSDYIRARLTFDIVWPLVYLFFLTFVTTWLLKKKLPFAPMWLNLIPLLACIFDYLENICAVLVYAMFPTKIACIAGLAGVFTMFKWLTISFAFAIICLLFLLFIYQVLRRKIN